MTKVEFDSATLAEAIKKANTVAPTRGRELDRYKGFVFEIFNDEQVVRLRCTNGDLFYSEFVYPNEIEGPDVTWRVSSRTTFAVASNLPIRAGKKVILEEVKDAKYGRVLVFQYGSMRATMPFIDHSDYPDWEDFDDTDLPVVENFGANIDAVSWACDSDGMPPKGGVYIDSEKMVGSNGFLMATIPIKMDLTDRDNIVVPVKTLSSALRNLEEVKVGVGGGQLLIAPTDTVHISCFMWDETYPNVNRMLSLEYDQMLVLDKEYMVEVLNRVKAIGVDDRQVSMEVNIGDNQISFAIEDKNSTESITESIELPDMADHEIAEYRFSAEYFLNAVQKSPGKLVTFSYNPERPVSPVKFEGANGYTVVVQPRSKVKAKKEEDE